MTLPVTIPCYISTTEQLMTCFKDKSNVDMAVELTQNDFCDRHSSLSKHYADPYLFRFLVMTENGRCMFLLDFRRNLQMAILPPEKNGERIEKNNISFKMEEILEQQFGFFYDRKNPPVFKL